jgi:peptidoglycan/xylan/chitin deacetylase (PgdA/CDA1 family)
MSRCMILNYHAVTQGFQQGDDPIYSIDQATFRRQLDWIRLLDLPVISLADLVSVAAPDKPTVILTFDDGHPSDYEIVFPILQEFGMTGAFFIPTSKMENRLSQWAAYREMLAAGNGVGSHGVTHAYLTDLDSQAQVRELRDSKSMIEDRLYTEVKYCALPGGRWNRHTLEAAKNLGYKGLLTTHFGHCDTMHPSFLISRWTIKRTTSLIKFAEVLKGNALEIGLESGKSKTKKALQRLIPSHIVDKINYQLYG